MNKLYEVRSELMELVEDGRLVSPLNGAYFREEQVESVLTFAKEVTCTIEEWCESRLASLANVIESLNENLKYADGGAYYQDLDRIRAYRRESQEIKKYLEKR